HKHFPLCAGCGCRLRESHLAWCEGDDATDGCVLGRSLRQAHRSVWPCLVIDHAPGRRAAARDTQARRGRFCLYEIKGMRTLEKQNPPRSDDERLLRALGYEQELARRMSGFSNFAISLSIICILAGGITSFHVGLCSAGGASIGLGWPLVCLFSLTVALTMAQVASAFPTAGGLYHWASLLGGRGCGWVTAWFNLAGIVTALGAINAGTYD